MAEQLQKYTEVMSVTGQCILAEDINHCQYYVRECSGCNAPHDQCGMLARENAGTKQERYVRKPKWYEKYYQK